MDLEKAMKALEAAGTEQARKTYRRHGVTGPQFGVSYAFLGKFVKQCGTDHDLAVGLWETGNHDARVLATMVADPERMELARLDRWAKELDCRGLGDTLARCLVGRMPSARPLAERWIASKNEPTACAGWTSLGMLSLNDPDLPDAAFEERLAFIEANIHGASNWVRYAMNNAVITVGMRSDALAKKAIAAAKRIGKVEVDHGDTACKTPDAATYIPKAREYAKKRQEKASKASKAKKPKARSC